MHASDLLSRLGISPETQAPLLNSSRGRSLDERKNDLLEYLDCAARANVVHALRTRHKMSEILNLSDIREIRRAVQAGANEFSHIGAFLAVDVHEALVDLLNGLATIEEEFVSSQPSQSIRDSEPGAR